ncbi:helix-turn-helix domain-containing protein [Alteraurantiacibacter aestuarii]|uniref:Metalloregulator ArsR/SmtB family transcription factor n=1 Tax=Alteraurantiacibacter aestuarii TaxID=650004 RepID=A0A844ZK64_9SPHN|nr:metalloregulator ArsR/SmtB family transcription factor [Alteraurantiacibacter aestuarii]MXO87662.1 metalloregulator ArsR/SmtB family transcription factor [Alteraurantiacibacter aestuarii]
MDSINPTAMFAALSQETRLQVFRRLIKAGPKGLLSGEIGEQMGVRQNTMSANLAILLNAGLIRNERQGRSVRYFANIPAISDLLRFLLEDCCGGDSALCNPLVASLASVSEDQR